MQMQMPKLNARDEDIFHSEPESANNKALFSDKYS